MKPSSHSHDFSLLVQLPLLLQDEGPLHLKFGQVPSSISVSPRQVSIASKTKIDEVLNGLLHQVQMDISSIMFSELLMSSLEGALEVLWRYSGIAKELLWSYSGVFQELLRVAP